MIVLLDNTKGKLLLIRTPQAEERKPMFGRCTILIRYHPKAERNLNKGPHSGSDSSYSFATIFRFVKC